MNKQSYYLLGGALLASTALTTGASAGTFNNDATSGALTALKAKTVATQVFSATATTANAQTLGNNGQIANNSLVIDLVPTLTSGFKVTLNVTNAAFYTGGSTPVVTLFTQSTSGSITLSTTNGCSVQPLPDHILITGCLASSATKVDAIRIQGLSFTSAGALAASGQSIKLDALVTDSAGANTYDVVTQASFITSKSAADAAVVASTGTLIIDNSITPVFSKFTNTTATAVLGSIKFSATSALGTDLSNTFASAASITGAAEVKVAGSFASDPALVSISISGAALKATPGQFVSGSVSFQVPAASLGGNDISVTFDGTTGITSATVATATVTPTTGPIGIITAVAPFSGSLATYSRGGLSVEVNSMFPTAGEGSTKYRSYIRIANQSGVSGAALLTVKNDATGALIGTFQTSVIAAGGTIQLGSDTIEASLSGAAAANAMYKVVVSGSFNGYVQHVLWNSVTGIFTDLSGFRNGALTSDP